MPSKLEMFLAQQKTGSSAQQLKAAIEEDTSSYSDFLGDKRWQPKFVKEDGSVEYVIRFLPSSDVSDGAKPYHVHHNHAFKENGQWFIETCPTSIDMPCPVCEDNRRRYALASEHERKTSLQLKARNRKTKYFANVLVVSDSQNPSNDGKIFVYEMPKTIFNYIQDAVKPKFKSEEPFDPFNLFTGKNLHIRATYDSNKKQWGYDKTFWKAVSPVTDHTDMELEEIFENLYNITDIIKDKGVLEYDDMKKKLELFDGTLPGNESRTTHSNPNVTMAKSLQPTLMEDDEIPTMTKSPEDIDLMSEIDGMIEKRKSSSSKSVEEIPF